jgi:hypothetical protein
MACAIEPTISNEPYGANAGYGLESGHECPHIHPRYAAENFKIDRFICRVVLYILAHHSPPPRVKKKISPPWLDPKTRQPKQAGIATVAAPEDAGAQVDFAEAHRIATELLKLHRDGAISGPNDPEARFLANLIHTFGATYTGRIQR